MKLILYYFWVVKPEAIYLKYLNNMKIRCLNLLAFHSCHKLNCFKVYGPIDVCPWEKVFQKWIKVFLGEPGFKSTHFFMHYLGIYIWIQICRNLSQNSWIKICLQLFNNGLGLSKHVYPFRPFTFDKQLFVKEKIHSCLDKSLCKYSKLY